MIGYSRLQWVLVRHLVYQLLHPSEQTSKRVREQVQSIQSQSQLYIYIHIYFWDLETTVLGCFDPAASSFFCCLVRLLGKKKKGAGKGNINTNTNTNSTLFCMSYVTSQVTWQVPIAVLTIFVDCSRPSWDLRIVTICNNIFQKHELEKLLEKLLALKSHGTM